MGTHTSAGALGLAVLCAACGSGGSGTGGSGNGGTGESLTGRLAVTGHDPAAEGIQIALDATVRVTFDAVVALECFQDEDTFLASANGEVPGSFSLSDAGKAVVFTPASPLERETDYTFQLAPLTCDTSGRILEDAYRFSFRTLDLRPPTVTSASVHDGQTGVSRTAPVTVTFDEPLDGNTVSSRTVELFDAFGTSYALTVTLNGAELVVQPRADLPGNRKFIMVVGGGNSGVTDRAGNALATDWSLNYWTQPDSTAPQAMGLWPGSATGISPNIRPVVSFDESIDPYSIEPASLIFTDTFLNLVPFTTEPSEDLRSLRLVPTGPLTPGSTYAIGLAGGLGGVTDVSGNNLAYQFLSGFTVGSDASPPALSAAFPADGATRVSPNAIVTARFDEALDPDSIDTARVHLDGPDGPIAAVVSLSGTVIQVTPDELLRPSTTYALIVRGGIDGVRDLAGNPIPADLRATWQTADDGTLPSVRIAPQDGTSSAPVGVRVSCIFDEPLDPDTVDAARVEVTNGFGVTVPGTLELVRGGRVVTFVPNLTWISGSWYKVHIHGGPEGVRERSGNWLDADVVSNFRAGFSTDSIAPSVEVTLNAADPIRRQNMSVPPFGFTINVETYDSVHFSNDLSTIHLEIAGSGGSVPGSDTIYAEAEILWNGLDYLFPPEHALEPGDYTLTASVRDLSGNLATSQPLAFRVVPAAPDLLPFERTQVVWVRLDLDRDGNGRADFDDDLLDLGFATPGDPLGTNARMAAVLRDGIFAQFSHLCGRAPNGSPLGPDSVPVRLTHRAPLGVPHMQIALGGFDPEGNNSRTYGDESTGTLGRAFFDFRNGSVNELNIQSNPGLGVFPRELFLFQAGIHIQVYPSFVTTFARRFLKISPHMGGVPAGSDPLDATVLDPSFDYVNATAEERARHDAVFGAADDWATAIGVILAHEIGHSVGLVAEGRLGGGLHGDSSLHNEFSSVLDVMASAVGYDAMVSLNYSFRDLNIAYLRQRLLLK